MANTLGFDTSIGSNLWKDRVCTELSVAVLHSFNTNGVAMVDHHTLVCKQLNIEIGTVDHYFRYFLFLCLNN